MLIRESIACLLALALALACPGSGACAAAAQALRPKAAPRADFQVEMIGTGPVAESVPLMTSLALDKDELLPAFVADWSALAPKLKLELDRQAEALAGRRADIEAQKKVEIDAIGDLAKGNTGEHHARLRTLMEEDLDVRVRAARIDRAKRLMAATEARLLDMANAWDSSAAGGLAPVPVLTAVEYRELAANLLGTSEGSPETKLQPMLLARAEAALGGGRLQRLLESRARKHSPDAGRFFKVLREEAEAAGIEDLRTQAHDGTGFYRHPGLAVNAVLVQDGERSLFSVDRSVLEYWLSPEGRTVVAVHVAEMFRTMEDGVYLRFLARLLLGRQTQGWQGKRLEKAQATLQHLGVLQLRGGFYAARPRLEKSFGLSRFFRELELMAIVSAFIVTVLLEIYLLQVNPWRALRHVPAYLALLLAFTRGTKSWFDLYRPGVLLDASAAPMAPLGLRTAAREIALRFGFDLKDIYLTRNGLGARALWSANDGAAVDLYLSEAMLQRTMAEGRTGALYAAIGQAVAHLTNYSALYVAMVSVCLWHLIDFALPLKGLAEWVWWGVSAILAYFLTWLLLCRLERQADLAGARHSGRPDDLAQYLRGLEGAHRPSGILPEPPSMVDLSYRARRLEDLSESPPGPRP